MHSYLLSLSRYLIVFFLCTAASNALAQTADLKMTVAGPSAASGGSDFTYTLTIDNNGRDTADGGIFVDTLPADVTNVSALCTLATGGAVCPASLNVSNTQISGEIVARHMMVYNIPHVQT